MLDLISRSALLNSVEIDFGEHRSIYVDQETLDFLLDEIGEASGVEAEPVVHAHWISKEDCRGEDIRCSACDESIYGSVACVYDSHLPRRCPYCGAHMDEEMPKRS